MIPVRDWFINRSERRLRALWRIILQIVLQIAIATVLGWLVRLGAVAWFGYEPGGRSGSLVIHAQRHPLLLVGMSTVMLLSALGSVWLVSRWLGHHSLRRLGLRLDRTWWRDFAVGWLLGGLLISGLFAVELALGWLRVVGTFTLVGEGAGFAARFAGMLLVVPIIGLTEELVSRGFLIRNLAEGARGPRLGDKAPIWLAWLLSSAFFGLLHILNPGADLVSSLQIGAAGLLLGLGYLWTGQLAIPIGLHISWNLFLGPVFGFPVSGLGMQASLIGIEQHGPVVWTGGAFGPEAGLLALAVIALGAAGVAGWVRIAHGRLRVFGDLALFDDGRDSSRDAVPSLPAGPTA